MQFRFRCDPGDVARLLADVQDLSTEVVVSPIERVSGEIHGVEISTPILLSDVIEGLVADWARDHPGELVDPADWVPS